MKSNVSTFITSCKRKMEHPRLGVVTFYRRKGSKNIRLSVSAKQGVLLSYPWHTSFLQALSFLNKNEEWAVAALEKTIERAAKQANNLHNLTPIQIEEMRVRAKQILPLRLLELAKLHNFVYSKVFIKNNKSNWGSCSAVNNINLNVRILLLPDHLQDYVILHELCHTCIKNHGKQFWDLLNSVSEGKAKEYAMELRKRNVMG